MRDQGLLRSNDQRARLMRQDTAELLGRLFLINRMLIIGQAGWIPSLDRIEDKAAAARMLWEDSIAADRMRSRILELRYPERRIDTKQHQHVVALFQEARNAPSPGAWLLGLARCVKPALAGGYQELLGLSDPVGDGPTHLTLRHALADIELQLPELRAMAEARLDAYPRERDPAEAWVFEIEKRLSMIGGYVLGAGSPESGDELQLPGRRPLEIPNQPGRDPRFRRVRFYWPHILDASYPSESGVHLQLRSAVGHVNEVWANEIAAATLFTFAEQLDWEFIAQLARWTYDESRHCLMGYRRLQAWGFRLEDVPLGDYTFRVARASDPIYGLGLLHFFETKYIHRTRDRIRTFADYQDSVSQHDYEFDWADETHHAGYGRRWLEALLAGPYKGLTLDEVLEGCERQVDEIVATATAEERQELLACAANLMSQADSRINAQHTTHG